MSHSSPEPDVTWERVALAVVLLVVTWTVLGATWKLLAEWAREFFRFCVHMTLFRLPQSQRLAEALTTWGGSYRVLWVPPLIAATVGYVWWRSDEIAKAHPWTVPFGKRLRAELGFAARNLFFLTLYDRYFVQGRDLFLHQLDQQVRTAEAKLDCSKNSWWWCRFVVRTA